MDQVLMHCVCCFLFASVPVGVLHSFISSFMGFAGESGGSVTTLTCPSNMLVVGFSAQTGQVSSEYNLHEAVPGVQFAVGISGIGLEAAMIAFSQ
jgi:hypothetical protein